MLHDQRTMALLFLLSLLFIQTLISSAADGPEQRVKEGDDVVLPCSINRNIKSTTFEWTKDGKEVYLYQNNGEPFGNQRAGQDQQFKDRTSHFQEELIRGNASIKITETKVADSGIYTCSFINPPGPTFSVKLVVECILKDRRAEEEGACPEPSVTSFYPEDGQAELQCKVHGVSDEVEIEWRDSSDHSLDVTKTQHRREDGSYNIKLNATVTKSGTYHCVITQKNICHQVSSSIGVNIKGACPKPHITSFYPEDGQAELQCEVHGVSNELEIEWRDSSDHSLDVKKTQHRREDGSYDIELNATVTKSGTYHCVITQKNICHQVSSFIGVNIKEPPPEPTKAVPYAGWIAFGTILAVNAAGIAFLAKRHFTRKSTKRSRKKEERPLNSSTDQVQNGSR